MRRLSPSKALLAYLDCELEGKAPPLVQPPRPGQGIQRRAALVVAALAIMLAGIGVATLALAQDAGTRAVRPERGHASRRAPSGDPNPDGTDSGVERPDAAQAEIRRPSRRHGTVARPQRQEPDGDGPAAESLPPHEPPPPGEHRIGQEVACVLDGGVIWNRSESEPYSCCALPSTGSSSAPPLAPYDPPTPVSGSVAPATWTVLLAVLLLLLATALVVAPDAVRRLRARRRRVERASRMAVESRRGGRRSNEDRSAVLSVDDYDVLIVADGMGGHIGGARAASIAVETACDYLVRRLPLARDVDLVADLVRSAFVRAAEALAVEDAEIGLGGHGVDALRTTLIVAVATPDDYVVGAQGDGGAWAQRASGITVALMNPAKGDAGNIVTASLGPAPEGQVEVTTKRRMKGDLLVVCSDGVADRVGLEFDEALRAYADDAARAEEIVRPILDSFEQRPAVFDDNITLGVLVTP